MDQNKILTINKTGWERSAERFFGRSALPEYGPFSLREEQLKLFGSISGKRVLDIGCGSGHSLQYMSNYGASELWGIDLSSKQIDTASKLLGKQHSDVKLFESPMEVNPGLPSSYFDIAYSIYALGWTVDLNSTLTNINNYLKPGGIFIFSWEHPFHDRIKLENGSFILNKSYLEEGPEFNEAWHNEVIIYHRKLSTYINSLTDSNFIIEKVIDDVAIPDTPSENPSRWYSTQKANLIPATFIIKASKKQ